MTKIAYFDCPSGFSGDMILSALIDAGADAAAIERCLRTLPLDGWQMQVSETQKLGVRAKELDFICPKESKHRNLDDIENILTAGALPTAALDFALQVFAVLAEAEARVHGCSAQQVHFHEVGALDSILDIAGIACAMQLLGIEKVFSAPLPLFSGQAECGHGTLNLPAPAVVELLQGCRFISSDIKAELITPTGAAVFVCAAAADCFDAPAFLLTGSGSGAGKKDLKIANILRIYLGEQTEEAGHVEVITATVDDASPELLGALWQKAAAAGALDLQMTPTYMKKGRPATTLTVIAAAGQAERLARMLFKETTTLGVRIAKERRLVLPRRLEEVQTPYGKILLKIALSDGEENIAPEYESCLAAAEQSGAALKTVYQAAVAAYLNRKG